MRKDCHGLNQFISAINRNRYIGNNLKQSTQRKISIYIKQQLRNVNIEKPVTIKFTWVEEDKRRDLDNIASAKKFILDSLVENGILKNDTSKEVVGFQDLFEYSDKSAVIVEITEIDMI